MREIQRIPRCGECAYFESEDVYGWGFCYIRQHSCLCDDKCELDISALKPCEVSRGLHAYQKWRRGKGNKAPLPYVVGVLIDASMRMVRRLGKHDKH